MTHRAPSFFPAFLFILFLLATGIAAIASAQTESASIHGTVTDPTGAFVPSAAVRLIDIDRGLESHGSTGNDGFFSFASVRSGHYRMEVEKSGFKLVRLTGITVNVQDNLEENFELTVGNVSQSITVEANADNVNITDGTVSTVVDRHFAESLPLNGRSFQSLIELTPGVVVTPSNILDNGQFSVNGQRADANYWMVDGVSANTGVGINTTYGGNGIAGALPAFSVVGGTNSLVSVDAMQEFRIQTSTYAPEFGRTPGGQISIVTRSGTNQFHGTAFDYLRNDVLDANNWFNGYTNNPPLPKAEERQNDFGGTLGGPILKDRTFFFFSYEGLRHRLPQTTLSTVPDLNARQNAVPAMQPFLNSYPLPNGTDNLATGIAQFNGSYSNPASLDAYSIRIDSQVNHNQTLFGRFN
jgi:hypothetical protein